MHFFGGTAIRRFSRRRRWHCARILQTKLVVSVVSLWEIEIKRQLGKLSLGRPLAVLVAEQQRTNQIEVMRVDLAHVLALGSLPSVHKDPFDRMLVAQAMSETLPLLSRDSSLSQYPVTILW